MIGSYLKALSNLYEQFFIEIFNSNKKLYLSIEK